MRKSWVQINGELVPKENYTPSIEHQTMIMPDIKEYKSMITGEMITSRTKHRNHLRQHNCFEVGNEKLERKERATPGGIKEDLIRNMRRR
jgi:hypothetical protein